jgi:hypothetical protein
MDREKLGEVISAGITGAEAVEAEHLLPIFSDTELLAEFERRNIAIPTGSLALEGATTPERTPLTPEALLSTFDTAYQTYGFLLDTANGARADTRGRKKPAQLETIDPETIRAEAEALLANPAVLEELQTEIDRFTSNPEVDSPEAGFDLVIVPEGLTTADEQAIAESVQAKITTAYRPYIRSDRYNDTRTPEVSGKGYHLAFAPRHYNVPAGTTSQQTKQMNAQNQTTEATSLQTATDAEALAAINNLVDTKQLDNPSTRFDQTYYRRFDQAPFDDVVSRVYVRGDGRLDLDGSYVHYGRPARALVVPKA